MISGKKKTARTTRKKRNAANIQSVKKMPRTADKCAPSITTWLQNREQHTGTWTVNIPVHGLSTQRYMDCQHTGTWTVNIPVHGLSTHRYMDCQHNGTWTAVNGLSTYRFSVLHSISVYISTAELTKNGIF